MKLNYLLFSLILLVSMNAKSQKLTDFISQDTMIYVYKLDKTQTNYIIEQNAIQDTSILFTHLYKTYPRARYKDDTLPNGNYIVTSITQNTINYRYVYKASFNIKTRIIGDDIIFYVQDTKTLANIEKASMDINGQKVEFNIGYGGYSINRKLVDQKKIPYYKAFLHVSLGEEYLSAKYSITDGYRAPKPQNNYSSGNYHANSEGYFITDKPIYKPGDTLRLKAFLMHPKRGLPIKRRAWLSITEPNQNFSLTKKIKPISRGAYTCKWPIPDTLKIDRSFNMNISFIKNGITFDKTGSFYLEDYQLNQNKYDVSLRNELFYAGEDITFYVSAKDANQFPLQGTLVHYKLSLNGVTELLTDSLRITAEKRANMYEKDTTYTYENYMELKIPSSILPKINANYNIEVTLTDPITYERKTFVKQFSKLTQKEKVIMYQQEDSMHIHCYYGLRDTARNYMMYVMSMNDTLYAKKITTPYSFKLTPFTTRVVFMDADSVRTPVDILFNKLDIAKVKGNRTHDSMKISFNFPFDEAVYYRILKGDKLIQSGKNKKLNFAIRDESKDSYTILFTTNLNGSIENNFYRLTFVPKVHQIKIQSTIPEQAFPGQKVPITISATDYKNKPLSKINIAAYAVNKQFENRLTTPTILIPNEFQDMMEVKAQEYTDNAYINYLNPNTTFTITKKHCAIYNLQKNEYYEIRYPRKEIAFISKPIQSKTPEFAVVLTHKDRTYSPKYILLDGQPIYISDLSKDIYSFPTNAGAHQITVRYFDKKYVLSDIQFEPNKKYFIGMNIDSVKKSTKKIQVIDSLTVAQPNENEKKLLYNSLVFTSVFPYDSMHIKNQNSKDTIYSYNSTRTPQTLNVDGDNFRVIGPLKDNTNAVLLMNKKEYALKVSSEYAHYYDSFTREFTTKKIGAIKGIIFGFAEKPISDYQLLELVHKDTLVKQPEKIQLEYNQKAYEANKEIPEQNFEQNYRMSASNGSMFSVIIKNIDKKKYVKSLWVINNSKPDQCDFIPNVDRINAFQFSRYGAPDTYDIYFLLNNNQYLLLKDKHFNGGDELYIDPSLFKSDIITNEKLATPLKFYNDLTSMPMQPFFFEPDLSSAPIKEVKHTAQSSAYLHGLITDISFQPIPQAIVLMEVNGVYKYGGYTNDNGEFEILNIPSGSYQIKVFHPNYQMQHYAPKFIQQGNEYVLNASVNPQEIGNPIYQTVNLDFQFLCFDGKQQSDILKVNLFDKDTRDILKGATIKLYYQEKLLYTKEFNASSSIEVPFPLYQDTLYHLAIQRPGYIDVWLYNIRFVKGMLYTLNTFLSKQDEKKLISKKEYNANMTDVQIESEFIPDPPTKEAKISYTSTKGSVSIFGRVTDHKNNGLDFASVIVYEEGVVKGGAKTDANGNFKIKPLLPGNYDLKVTYIGYHEQLVNGIQLRESQSAKVDISLDKKSIAQKEVTIKEYKVSLIEASDPGAKVITRDQYSYSSPSASYAPPQPSYSAAYSQTIGDISISGARSSNTLYMIDGMQIKGSSNFQLPSAGYSLESISAKYGNATGGIYVSDDMINSVANNSDISQTRKNFTDVGFWEPNHITDKSGKTNFEIKLPDNITTWKSTILAMGKHRLHGMDTMDTKVYKPLQTISVIPQFIWDNDKIYAKAKFTNLTKDEKQIHIHFTINNKLVKEKDIQVKNDITDSILLSASSTKPLLWNAGLLYQDKYKDEEEREIPVYSSAFKLYDNQYIMLDKDSTYKLNIAKDVKGTITLNNVLYEKIVHEINELNNYEYGCVEQTASKLKALLCKFRINQTMGLKENLTPPIYNLINRLSNFQNSDGTWGWWKRQSVNWRMTIYAMDVLYSANSIGYTNSNFVSARRRIEANFSAFNSSDKLYAFYVLQKMGVSYSNMKTEIDKIKLDDMRPIDKVYFYKIKENLGEFVEPSDMYALSRELNNQVTGYYNEDFFFDPRSTLFTSYFLFSKSSIGNEFIQVFRDKLSNGQLEQHLNTYAKASMIEALTNSVENTGNKPITSTVIINDTLEIKTFPYSFPINAMKYSIKHTGGNVFLNTAEESWTFLPKTSDSLFSISTSFIQRNKTVTQIEVGTPCQLKFDLKAFRTKDYVMVEIPIPSGMRVTNKPQLDGASIEYFKQKIVIFYNKLNMDNHQLSFDMLPILKGSCTMPAAKCSLMYYPYIYGNNETKTIEIK